MITTLYLLEMPCNGLYILWILSLATVQMWRVAYGNYIVVLFSISALAIVMITSEITDSYLHTKAGHYLLLYDINPTLSKHQSLLVTSTSN